MEHAAAKKTWVLVVEDDPEMRISIRDRILKDIPDCRVIESQDGADARRCLDNQMFHCVITDLNMPKMGGDTVIKYTRSSKLNARTPLILITGKPDPKVSTGHDHVLLIAKPFKSDDLIRAIDEQLKLGTTESRIPIELFNFYLASVVQWAAKQGLEPKAAVPQPRADLTGLLADSYVFHRFAYRASKPWIALGLTAEMLTKLGQDSAQTPASPSALGESIWETFRHRMHRELPEGSFALIDRMLCEPASMPTFMNSNFRGVTVPIETKLGTLYIEGFTAGTAFKKLKS